MDLEKIDGKIREVERKECNSSTVTSIPLDFYQDVEKYIKELEEELKKISTPRSPEAMLLQNELQNTIRFVESIFMNRVKKIIPLATSQAFSGRKINRIDKKNTKNTEKMLPSEKMLYELVLQGIEAAKIELLDPILYPDSGEVAVWPQIGGAEQAFNDKEDTGRRKRIAIPVPIAMAAINSENLNSTNEAMGVTAQSLEMGQEKNNINEEYVVVRILKDLPTFTGADGRNYTVNAEEVVVLPHLNASGLIKRNAAKLIVGHESPEKNLLP